MRSQGENDLRKRLYAILAMTRANTENILTSRLHLRFSMFNAYMMGESTLREKPTQLHFYLEDAGKRNQLDDLILLILSACDNPEVLEAYGHNQLLYLADKFVKREVQLMKGTLRGVVDLELTPLARKEKVFSIARRFRDLRAESESARRQTAQAPGEGRT